MATNKAKFNFIKEWAGKGATSAEIGEKYTQQYKSKPNTALIVALRRAAADRTLSKMTSSSQVRAAYPPKPKASPPRALAVIDKAQAPATLVPSTAFDGRVMTSVDYGLTPEVKKAVKQLCEQLREKNIETLALDLTGPELKFALTARPVMRCSGTL